MAAEFAGSALPLTDEGFNQVAETLGIEAAKLWAVVEIEAKRCGYLEDRRPVILYERHIFHRRTGGRFDGAHPGISSPSPGGYGMGGANQYLRLTEASRLDRGAALASTSWGLGQIMGFNAGSAGFADVETMVREMCASEDAQLRGMMHFLRGAGLDKPLRVGNWVSFARGYNGENYAINKYDDRLRGAYQKFATGPMPDLMVRAAQLLLTYLGFSPGLIDGWPGSRTMQAFNAFRARNHLPEAEKLTEDDVQELFRAVQA